LSRGVKETYLTNRLVRLASDASYRAHVRNEAKLFARYPRAVGYKSAAMVLNRGHRLGRRLGASSRVDCPVCGWTGNAFDAIATFGYWRRNARCPGCGSLERHRAMIEFLVREGWVQRGDSCLDIGGIPPFRSWFENQGVQYVSMSLGDPAMVRTDIQQMGFADESFDLMLDSHVLEYVSDYRQALREMSRVLRPGGRMLLTETYDFGQPVTKEFGWPNPEATFMVRRFGNDLPGLLERTGFQTTRWDYTGRNDANGDYFFLSEKTSSIEGRSQVA
jgi:SAM-dependent methyltransferase